MEYNTFATYNNPTPSNKEKLVVGIDIGTTKIACVVGKIDSFGKVTILGIGRSKSDGVKRGIVLNIDQETIGRIDRHICLPTLQQILSQEKDQ